MTPEGYEIQPRDPALGKGLRILYEPYGTHPAVGFIAKINEDWFQLDSWMQRKEQESKNSRTLRQGGSDSGLDLRLRRIYLHENGTQSL